MTGRALTIAGSDCGGGAGIQADLKTFHELAVYGMSVVTAVTAQNSCGVQAIHPLPAACIADQLEAVLDDIGTDAIKTGMLYSADIVDTVARRLQRDGSTPLVVDPVMAATQHNCALLQTAAIDALKSTLLPLAKIVTPNIPEARRLLGIGDAAAIATVDDMKEAAKAIHRLGPQHVILKGGHLPRANECGGGTATDIWYDGRQYTELQAPLLPAVNTHGTGCVFSAALTAALASGSDIHYAVHTAKHVVTAAIATAFHFGRCGGRINPAGWRTQRPT